VRAAGARYQRSEKGRERHAARQRRYRARRRAGAGVTHQGDSGAGRASAIVEPAPAALAALGAGGRCGGAESGDATASSAASESAAHAACGDAGAGRSVHCALTSGGSARWPVVARCARCGRPGRLWRERSAPFDR